MVTQVQQARADLHNEYVTLRLKIFDHYQLLPLVGESASNVARRLPPKLGHWGPQHSERVLSEHPELIGIVRQIEALRGKRTPEAILAAYGPPLKRGGWRKKRSLNSSQEPELKGEAFSRRY